MPNFDSVDSLQLLNSFRDLRLPILDDMTFIQDDVVPPNSAEEVQVIPNDIVGGDDEIVAWKETLQSRPLCRRSVVMQRSKRLMTYELFHFVHPMTCKIRIKNQGLKFQNFICFLSKFEKNAENTEIVKNQSLNLRKTLPIISL
jgi:hypothetical protein